VTNPKTAYPLPPIPDVPHVIGLDGGDDLVHAVSYKTAVHGVKHGEVPQRAHVTAECGTPVMLARRWGPFHRGNEHVSGGDVCGHCAWTVAVHQGTTGAELTAITPTGAELAAMKRLMPDPLLAVRICQHLLTAMQEEREYDAGHPRWPQLLGHATAHRPRVLVGEGCTGDCDHPDAAACYSASDTVACDTCSIQVGSWAGEWEGMYECFVPAPCAVLPAMATRYGALEVAR
jgi:hypothetical protein